VKNGIHASLYIRIDDFFQRIDAENSVCQPHIVLLGRREQRDAEWDIHQKPWEAIHTLFPCLGVGETTINLPRT
jgi:hypothetical protein